MHHEFCTLFDSNYLFKALAMYESMQRHCASFTLTACCFDKPVQETLEKLQLPNLVVISVGELERSDPELASTKADRTPVEYCWTATAPLVKYVLASRPEVNTITYIDADLLFFADPDILFEEIGEDSICITPHRFSPEYSDHRINGIYCVQWVMFRRDERGLEALEWWRQKCIEWCYYRLEDGKLGDQKYLDDWPKRFRGVCELNNPGGGLAPWNISQYKLRQLGENVIVDDVPLVFFHYHRYSLSRTGPDRWRPPGYVITPSQYELIYSPYQEALERAKRAVWSVAPGFDAGLAEPPPLRTRTRVRLLRGRQWLARTAPWTVTVRRLIGRKMNQ